MASAKRRAQAHGYAGLNFRDIGADVGIKHASVYHHFATKADLGAAVARRYWEDTARDLETVSSQAGDPLKALAAYPGLFRHSLESDNRMCMASFMAAEYDDLPDVVKAEVKGFSDVNVAWLSRMLTEAGLPKEKTEAKARAIYAAVAGAQLMARGLADIGLFDTLVESYRESGLIPSS